jgi:CheY-like chemotaxis protein
VSNLGDAEYAVKPVRHPELLRLVCKLLSSATSQRNCDVPMPRDQFLIQGYLKLEPYELTFVENGKLAVEAALGGTFDLILMDTQMPVMNGLIATQLIRDAEKQAGRTPVPFLSVTANARQEDIVLSRAAGRMSTSLNQSRMTI